MKLIDNENDKFIENYDDLNKKINACKTLGLKVVCTIGSWDMLHPGHTRYLKKAKSYGDVLVVGVDTDKGIKKYKGDGRPIIPQVERIEMLSYLSFVDFITVVDDIDEKGNWGYGLIKSVPIDNFVSVENDSYTDEQIKTIKEYCNLVQVPRQAESTSSSIIIQKIMKQNHPMLNELIQLVEKYQGDLNG